MSERRGLAPVLVGAPAVVGVAVAGLLLARGESRELLVRVPLPTVAAALGIALTLVAAVALGWRAVLRRARRRAHDAAVERERAAHRRFLGRLDHEIKNPVTATRAAAAGLRQARDDDERVRLTAILDSQTARLAALVADLRKLGEIEQQELEHELVDLTEVVADAVEDRLAQAAAAGARREVVVTMPQVPWPLPVVRGDMDLLYLAVSNVLGNALKFSPAGSVVEVRGSEQDATVTIEVADAGMGIPPDEIDTVLDELARGRDARGVPGSGIGLALVRAVVERHGGRVALRSRPGSGTVVTLTLPRP